MASPILNVTELWIASTGEILDQSGTSQFHAQNNYANLILVNLEDGVGYDSTTLINFTPQTKSAYTSHWFYMSYQGLVEHEVGGEVKSFAQYAIRVPRVVLQNSNKNGFTVNDVVVKQTYGTNFIGQFATLAELNSENPPTEALDDSDSVAYVIADADKGFYQVELDGTYGWALMDNVALALESKQYNQFQIQVQAGSANPNDVVSVSAENVTIIMGILNNLQIDIDRIDANIDEIEEDIDTLEGRATVNEEDIDLLEGRATVLETFKDTTVPATYETKTDAATHKLRTTALEGRATDLETFQSTTVPATYETISNVDLVRDRVDDLETFEDVTVPATYETKVDATTHKQRTTNLESANMFKSITFTASTGTLTLTRFDNTTATVDLPTELIVSGGEYDEANQDIILHLANGDDIVIPLDDLFNGLATQTWTNTQLANYYTKTELNNGQLDTHYYTETESNNLLATKVDKDISAYNNLTAEENKTSARIYVDDNGVPKKMTLGEIYEGANSASGAFVPNGVYQDLTAGYAMKSESGVDIDDEFIAIDGRLDTVEGDITNIEDGTQNITFDNTISGLTATTVKGAIDEIDGRVDILESKIDVVGLDYKEYGVREVVGQSDSDFERVTRFWGEIKLGSATGLVANVAIDDADTTNSFDYIPIFKREKVSIDATDLSSNTVSNTFVKVPKFYIKEEWVTEGTTDYHYIFMSQFKHDGYRLPLPFKKQDGSERDYAYMGAYEAYLDGNNKLRSLTGQIPKVSYSRNNFRTAARALDGLGINSKYQITDLAEYVDLVQIPFMIEFATKHSQGVFAGATSMAYSASHTAIAEGTGVNFIVVSNATGANFVLGQTVSIGTSNSNDSVAKDRIITQIQVDTPNAGETTITFDGAAVNIAISNVVASRAWKTGMTDNVKVSGSHALNDGKHSIVWRGLENPFGNIWKNVDGVKISNWRGYITENPKDYNDTASVAGVYAEPYLPLGYLNANTNNYAQELGYDANYPYAKFPISVQASSGLFFRDYYYQNSGDRTVFVGGHWFSGSGAGLFYWALDNALGFTNFNFGARLSYRP